MSAPGEERTMSDEQRGEPAVEDLELDAAAAETVRGGADKRPVENLSLTFTRVKNEYTP